MNRLHHIFLLAALAIAPASILVISAVPAMAWDVTIAWDRNTEPDLGGYTIYYAKHSPGPPYDFIGDLPLSSFPNSIHPSTQVTNLENGVEYFFAVTAYDTDGNESTFSSYLCAWYDGQTIIDCTPAPASSFSNSSGSGSSGCFIQSAGNNPRYMDLPIILLMLFCPTIAFAIIPPATLVKPE